MRTEIEETQQHLEGALQAHRWAREAQIDTLECLCHIQRLAERAMSEPGLAGQIVAEIAATAENGVRNYDDAVSTIATARSSISSATNCIRRAAKAEQTEDTL